MSQQGSIRPLLYDSKKTQLAIKHSLSEGRTLAYVCKGTPTQRGGGIIVYFGHGRIIKNTSFF